jgi:rubrerythrin
LKSKRVKARKKPVLTPPESPVVSESVFSADPSLALLRKTAVAEREAIIFYLGAANLVDRDLRALFLAIAEDEMRHFVQTMTLIAGLDPVQAKALEASGLGILIMPRAATPRWAGGWPPTCAPLPEPTNGQPAGTMTAAGLLTKAMNSELDAVNLYQDFTEKTRATASCDHFCRLMNDEKHHVAQFIAALYELTCEPPPLLEHDGNIM